MSKSIYEKATDKNIITKQVVINTPTSAHLLPITADEKVIDEIQQALNELERLKKIEKLLKLYKEINNKRKELITLSRHNTWSWKLDLEIKEIQDKINELENEENEMSGISLYRYFKDKEK